MGGRRRASTTSSKRGKSARSADRAPSTQARAPHVSHVPSRTLRWAVVLLVVLGAVAALLEWQSRRRPARVLASLPTEGLDPMVALAVDEAEAAVRAEPRSGAAWGKLGQVLFVNGLDGPAAECLARAESFSPNDARWPYLRGRAVKRENGDAALPLFRRAADLTHGNPASPTLLLAELLLERGDLDEARARLDEVLRRDPTDARALLDRARLAIATGDWAAARRDLEASARRTPDARPTHLMLASVYGRTGETAAAARESARARALSETPTWPDPFVEEISSLALGKSAMIQRASRLVAQGHAREAVQLLEAGTQHYGDNDDALWLALGDAAAAAGDAARADSAYHRAAEVRPGSPRAQLQLGAAMCDHGQCADAAARLREAVRLSPNLPEPHYRLGVCLMRRGDAAGAGRAFADAIRVEPSYRPAYVAWAALLEQTGKPSDAARLLRQALDLDPADPEAAAMLARLEGKSKT